MYKPLVSVITPVHNSGDFVGEAIRSVQAQTFSDWEMIIVDDCSTDDSAQIVETFLAEDDRIRIIKLPANSGAAVARNTAIEAAQGRYIAFLDSDDLWLPKKLEKQLSFMRESGTAFSYSAYARIDEKGKTHTPIGVPESLRYRDLCKTNYIGCSTAIYNTEVYGKRLMPIIRYGQDFALWLELLRNGNEARGLNMILTIYRVRSDSLSSRKIKGSNYVWRIYRNMERLSFMKALNYFSQYAARGVLRHKFPNLALKLGLLKTAKW
jgi:glycosyltransferase involved in cell wall biosynthesis